MKGYRKWGTYTQSSTTQTYMRMKHAVTGRKPEMITLSEVRRQGKRDIIEYPFWRSLKMDTNELSLQKWNRFTDLGKKVMVAKRERRGRE